MAALVLCIWKALPRSLTMTAMHSLTHMPQPEGDPTSIVGLVVACFMAASFAIGSSLLSDHVVLGAAAGAMVLRLITLLVSPNLGATLVLDGLVSLPWAIGAVASLVFLISGPWKRAA